MCRAKITSSIWSNAASQFFVTQSVTDKSFGTTAGTLPAPYLDLTLCRRSLLCEGLAVKFGSYQPARICKLQFSARQFCFKASGYQPPSVPLKPICSVFLLTISPNKYSLRSYYRWSLLRGSANFHLADIFSQLQLQQLFKLRVGRA